jgi:plastocyanin
MRAKYLLLAMVLTLTVCLYRQPVKASGAAHNNATGTASVRGTVRLAGTVPQPKPISMAADPLCTKQHAGSVFTQDILVDAKGALQNVVVFVAHGLPDGTSSPSTAPAVIEQKGCMYLPHVIAVRANQPLQMVNSDPISHNIHPIPVNNREWNKAEPPGSKIEDTFAHEEIAIPVKCNVHPWMRAYIAVLDHPYFALTGKDGTFDLGNLPPGTFTIKAWHEKLGTSSQLVTVGANETREISFEFKGVRR